MGVARAAAAVVVLALLGLLVWDVTHSGKGGVAAKVDKGHVVAAPKTSLPWFGRRGSFDLAAYRGKVVVLNFWASWCGPCKQEAPAIESLWQQFRSKGVVFVGVDSKDFAGDARDFMRRYRLTYPVVRDGDGALWGPYGVSGVPETRVIGRNGKYTGTQFYGATTASDLRASIEHALRT